MSDRKRTSSCRLRKHSLSHSGIPSRLCKCRLNAGTSPGQLHSKLLSNSAASVKQEPVSRNEESVAQTSGSVNNQASLNSSSPKRREFVYKYYTTKDGSITICSVSYEYPDSKVKAEVKEEPMLLD